MLPSTKELKARVITPKITAALSFIGSALIIIDFVKRFRKNRSKITPRSRLLAALSVLDCMASAAWFFTSWPIPADDIGWSFLTLYNIGTVQTCTAQGFFVHMSIGTLMYNCCLSLYYLLVIKYGWSNDKVAKKVEPLMHCFSIGFALITGFILLATKSFNPAGWDCYISSTPPLCEVTNTCVRGENASLYRDIFWFWPVWITISWLTISMLMIFLKIRNLEKRMAQYSGTSNSNQKKFAWQSFFYVGSMILTWILASSMHVYMKVTGNFPSFWLLLFATTMVPSQGFFNAVIYFSKADQGKKKDRSGSSVGLSRFFNQSRMMRSITMGKSSVSRKSSDITADLGDTTTNENGNTNASELVSQDIKGEEQNDEEGGVVVNES